MTDQEIRAALLYETKGMAFAGKQCSMTHAEVLHCVAEYRNAKRRERERPECERCRFRPANRHCVMPLGICGMELWRRNNV